MNASVHLYERAMPALVHVQASTPADHPSARLLGTERMGSGVVISADGLILTVHYVAIGASRVAVTLLDGRRLDGEVMRHDFASGLGLVRVEANDLLPLPLHDSHDVAVGEDVFIAASIGPDGARVSTGGVSHIGPFDANWEYLLDRALMTTAVNPGLGGGPLVDRFARVVGIVSLNLNEIGRFALAIPAERFLEARDAFLAPGPRGMGGRPWVGMFCYPLGHRLVVAGVMTDGPGARGGLAPGDVVLAVDEQEPPDRGALYRQVWGCVPGAELRLTVQRGNRRLELSILPTDVVAFFA